MSNRIALSRRLKGLVLKHVYGMVTCRQFDEFLSRCCERSLAPSERRRLSWHARLCRECRDYLAAYQRAQEVGRAVLAASAADALAPASTLEERIVARIDAQVASDASGAARRATDADSKKPFRPD